VSGLGDHNDEMPGPAAFDDATLEAFLSGRPVGAGELGPLCAFAEDVRVVVDRPAPAPTAEMARLLAEGIPTPTGVTRAALAPRAGARDADVPKRRKTMTITELLAALMAKLAGLGAASKAALGLGVAAASVTGAGAAGVLPDAAQHAVAEVVSAATPFELEDPRDAVADAADDAGDLADDADDGATDGDGDTGEPRNHGACVSEAAHNAPRGPGGEHGRAVSAIARSDCGKTTTTSSPSTTTTVLSSTTTTTVDDDQTTLDANRGRGGPGGGGNPNHGNSGPGNSGNGNSDRGNSGNGNSGPGNSGNGGGQGNGRSGR
jgi:hypothetical protein